MNNTTFGFNADTSCLTIGSGVIPTALKAGASAFSFHNVMDKHYTTGAEFAKRLYDRVWMNSSGIKPKTIILNLAYAPHFMMTPQQKAAIPDKFKAAGEYSNRWFPADLDAYKAELNSLIMELQKYPAMWETIEFELGQEPSAPRYWWGTFDEYKLFAEIKEGIIKEHGKPCYGHHLPASLLKNPNKARNYYDLAKDRDMYSTSFYEITNDGTFDYLYDDIPPLVFNSILWPEVNYRASLKDKTGNLVREFHSPAMMAFYIRFLKWSWERVQAQTEDKKHRIFFYTLYSCSTEADKGLFGYWLKNPSNGTYQYYPRPYQTPTGEVIIRNNDGKYAWHHMVAFLSVIKDGWTSTPDGVMGYNGKRIRVREDGLSYTVE